MIRKVFFSFHYEQDSWRTQEVRNMGIVEGNKPVSVNQWETVTQGGDTAIRKWIDGQMFDKSCVIVLIGKETAGRKWINYETNKAWDDGKGLLGIYIHNLKDRDANRSAKGKTPFDGRLSRLEEMKIIPVYDPPHQESTAVYRYIKDNIIDWVEEAIRARQIWKNFF